MKVASFLTILFCAGSFLSAVSAQSQQQSADELLYQIIQSDGIDAAVDRYRKQAEDTSGTGWDAGVLNTLGYRLLNEARFDEALSIFELNAEFHPESINVWDSLGDGYLATGENEKALGLYRKVLELLESDSTMPPPTRNYLRTNAETSMKVAEHFDGRAVSELHYATFYGGVPAGNWDMKNIIVFKQREGRLISYAPNNLYFNPVPDIAPFFTEGSAADVTAGFMGGDYRRFIEKDGIADISELWDEQGWNSLFPEPFRKLASHNDRQYFIPMAYQWNPVWYRKDIFEKHGLTPPESWEGLLALCDRLNELGYTPFTVGVQNWPPPTARWFSTLNLRLNGPEFNERLMRGEIPYTDERVRNVFVRWRELFRRGAFADSSFSNNYMAAVQELNSGEAVMYNLGEWLFESISEEQGARLDFFPFPVLNPKVTQAEIVHSYGAFIRSGTDKREQAEDLLKWLASRESQESNVRGNKRTVAHARIDPTLYTDVQKRIVSYINSTEVLVPLLEMNTHPEFARRALAVFQEYWADPENIVAAMQKLEAARQEVFN